MNTKDKLDMLRYRAKEVMKIQDKLIEDNKNIDDIIFKKNVMAMWDIVYELSKV